MKHKVGLIFIALLLTGCDESYVEEVKSESVLNYSALTYREILDNRKVCENVEWESEKINNTPTVSYACTLKEEGGIKRTEKIVWEKSRAMNGYVITSQTLEQTFEDGKTETMQLDPQRLMYGAVYDLINMEKYLKLHLLK